MNKQVYILTLGCPKNTVDSENIAYLLDEKGYSLCETDAEADIIIINTCSFIHDAKEESIEAIMEAVLLKEQNPEIKIVVCGCFAQRYASEIETDISEVDYIVGTGDFFSIVDIIENDEKTMIENINAPIVETGRILTTPSHYAYVKLAEGCNKKCTYCIIPKLRGKQRSRQIDEIVKEVNDLVALGVREIILIAQDTGEYGTDLYKERSLYRVIDELSKIDDLRWLRVLYVYPETIDERLITSMRNSKNFVHYLDIPFQHINDEVLHSMGRNTSSKKIKTTIDLLRKNMPDVIIRSSFITGFPNETKEQAKELGEFFIEYKLDKVGVFTYSMEEGTKAATFTGQLEEDEKQRRFEYLMNIQETVSEHNLEKQLDRVLDVVIEEDVEGEDGVYIGRSYADAPQIDGVVYVYSDEELEIGEFYQVEINDSLQHDLIGRVKI